MSVNCQVANLEKSAQSVKVSVGLPRRKLMKGRLNAWRGMSGGWDGGSRQGFLSFHVVAGVPGASLRLSSDMLRVFHTYLRIWNHPDLPRNIWVKFPITLNSFILKFRAATQSSGWAMKARGPRRFSGLWGGNLRLTQITWYLMSWPFEKAALVNIIILRHWCGPSLGACASSSAVNLFIYVSNHHDAICCRIFVSNTKHGWHLPRRSSSSSSDLWIFIL